MVGIPGSLPYFFASLTLATALAFVGAVIFETLASNDGIGYLMVQAASQFRTPLTFAGVMVIAAIGIATYAAFALIEKRFTSWATRRHAMVGVRAENDGAI
jgi:NitT/TauT family transport system permease protein